MAFGLSAGAIGLIGAGAGLIGGAMSAGAAGDAADAQSASAAQSDATQRYQYDTTRADNAPFRETGLAANNRLAMLLGLDVPTSVTSTANPRAAELQAYIDRVNADTADLSNNQPSDERDRLLEKNRQEVARSMSEMSGYQQQTQQAQRQDPLFGSLNRKFSAADMNADPVYQNGLQFGLNEGTKGINRQAAAGGSMLSGATLKALTRFGNDYGSTKANESYNRFNNDQNAQYNKLAGLSGAGQQATNQISAAGQNMANNISASQIGAGNARASGYVGQANAWNGAIGGATNALQQYSMMNRMFPTAGYSGATGYTGGSDPMGDFISSNGW